MIYTRPITLPTTTTTNIVVFGGSSESDSEAFAA